MQHANTNKPIRLRPPNMKNIPHGSSNMAHYCVKNEASKKPAQKTPPAIASPFAHVIVPT